MGFLANEGPGLFLFAADGKKGMSLNLWSGKVGTVRFRDIPQLSFYDDYHFQTVHLFSGTDFEESDGRRKRFPKSGLTLRNPGGAYCLLGGGGAMHQGTPFIEFGDKKKGAYWGYPDPR